jgi:hypothetical protein
MSKTARALRQHFFKDWDSSVLTGGWATMGATGTAHFGTVGNQVIECPIRVVAE